MRLRRHARFQGHLDRSQNRLLIVMQDEGVFKMWYVGGSEWVWIHGKYMPRYELKYIESPDGKHFAATVPDEDTRALVAHYGEWSGLASAYLLMHPHARVKQGARSQRAA